MDQSSSNGCQSIGIGVRFCDRMSFLSGLWTRRSLVQVPSGCQYSMRLDQLHKTYLSLHLFGVPHRYQSSWTLRLTGACQLIDGCSLELCSATPSVTSPDICHRNKSQLNCMTLSRAQPEDSNHYITYITFMASTSCRLGKRCWNLKTSSAVVEF